MSKKDEMAIRYSPTDAIGDERMAFEAGWDAALLHDERVLALVEALEFVTHCYTGTSNPHSPVEVWDALFKDASNKSIKALTKFRESVKK